jgi:hypothetical protein
MRPQYLLPVFYGVLFFVQLASGHGAALAQDVALNPNRPETYVVRPGDSLWDIAGRFLRDPWDWQKVWEANPDVANPNLIYPGDTLRLTYSGGRPRVRAQGGKRVVKLSPRVRVEELEAPVPTIPISVIAPFLSQPYVAQTDDIKRAPYVVGFPDEHITAGVGDAVYVRGIRDPNVVDFEIARPGQPYEDPDTGEILGYEAAFVANARVERGGDPAKLYLTRSATEVLVGDRLVPAANEEVLSNFYPVPAPPGMRARIIAVLNGVSQIGQYNIVVLNRGARDGVQQGHVFEGYTGGDVRRDRVRAGVDDWNWRSESPLTQEFWYGEFRQQGWLENRPDPNAPLPLHADVRRPDANYVAPFEQAALVMVFRVFDRVSFALVMRATRAMHVLDTVAAPRS